MKFITSVFISAAILFITSVPTFAQETDVTVVDEVIAQVNESVITLSQAKLEFKTIIDSYTSQGKSKKEAEALVETKKGQIIANLITEELLLQKGKEIGVERNVEAQLIKNSCEE